MKTNKQAVPNVPRCRAETGFRTVVVRKESAMEEGNQETQDEEVESLQYIYEEGQFKGVFARSLSQTFALHLSQCADHVPQLSWKSSGKARIDCRSMCRRKPSTARPVTTPLGTPMLALREHADANRGPTSSQWHAVF